MKLVPAGASLAKTRLFFKSQYPFVWVMAGFFPLLVFHGRALTQNYFYLFLLLPFLLAITAADIRDFLKNPVIVAFAAYLATLWLSLIWTGATSPATLLYHGRTVLIELAFVAQIAWLLRRDRASTERILGLSFALCLVFAILVSLMRFADASFGERLVLFMWHNPNTGAAVSGVAALLLSAAWMNCRNGWLRVLIALLLLGLLAEIVLSWSRATLISVSMAFLAVLLVRRSLTTLLLLAIPLPVIILIAGAMGWADPLGYFRRADSARFEVWTAFWGPIRDHLWTGIGIHRQFELAFDISGMRIDNPHNMLLVSALYAGVLAAVAWIGLLGAMATSVVSAVRSGRAGDQLALAMFIFILLHGLVESVLLIEMTNWQWLYLLLPLGCVAGAGFRDPLPSPRRGDAAGCGV